MSIYLNFGLITPNEMISMLEETKSANYEAFVRQLFWREYSRLYYRVEYSLQNNCLTKAS